MTSAERVQQEAQRPDAMQGAALLRPRSAYEAVDFGFHLVRRDYFRLVVLVSLMVLPGALLLVLFMPEQSGWLGLAVWWCKPVWERAVLFSLSRGVFGTAPSVREILRCWRDYLPRDLFLRLTLRRLSPTRSFDMPVTVLEGTTGRARSARLGVLHRGSFPSAAVCLTLLLIHVEMLLAFGILALFEIMIPDLFDWSLFAFAFGLEEEASLGGPVLLYVLGVLAIVLVCPFYVGAGFSLYLHRRTDLEAWDLELAFRRLATRVRASRPSFRSHTSRRANAGESLRTSLMIFALVFGLVSPFGEALAEAEAGRISTAADSVVATVEGSVSGTRESVVQDPLTQVSAREKILDVLAGEAFHEEETIQLPKFLLDLELGKEQDSSSSEWPDWLTDALEALVKFFGGSLELLIVSLALAAVAWVVWRLLGSPALGEALGRAAPRAAPTLPTELFGLEVTEESLPPDVAAAARVKARSGQMRAALALLYRGALARLGYVYGADLSKGVTEGECLQVARPLLSAEGGAYFASLTATWLRCAYGHMPPGESRMEALCAEWGACFDRDKTTSDEVSVNMGAADA